MAQDQVSRELARDEMPQLIQAGQDPAVHCASATSGLGTRKNQGFNPLGQFPGNDHRNRSQR
jgi:hypothetical protein